MNNPSFMLFLVLVYTLAAVWDGSMTMLAKYGLLLSMMIHS